MDSLNEIRKDPSVKGVILRVNSPGGTSDASEQILMECADLPQVVHFYFQMQRYRFFPYTIFLTVARSRNSF